MMSFPRFSYRGSLPTGASTAVLFSSVTAGALMPSMLGLHKFSVDIWASQAGTLTLYKSQDRGVTWKQIDTVAVSASTTASYQGKWIVEPYVDWKFEWTNGGVDQTAFLADMALVPRPASVNNSVTPLTIFGGASSVLQWCRSDLGVVLSGSNMVSWADQSGNGNHYNTMSASPPTYTASDASLGGRPTINFARASSQYMKCGLNLPAPGTTPTWMAAVARYRAWNLNAVMFGADSALCMMLRMGPTAAPNLRIVNAANGVTNNGLALNEWGEVECYFSNSVADYSCLRGLMQTGASAGNTSATGRRIGGFAAAFCDMDVAEIVYLNRLPSDTEIANWLAYLGLP